MNDDTGPAVRKAVERFDRTLSRGGITDREATHLRVAALAIESMGGSMALKTEIVATLRRLAGVEENPTLNAASTVANGIAAGRQAFQDGKPRDSLSSESERIGWDEAAHDAGVTEPPPCPACDGEERGQGGYLSCECPAVSVPSGVPGRGEGKAE